MIGSVDTRLVILRGNSGSGKSTVARRLRERLGRGVAWIEQDHLRRVVLGEHDRPGMPNIGLIDQTCRYALDAGYHAIVDGILITDHYRDMLLGLINDHRGGSVAAYFDIPLEETLRRHRGRPLAAEVADDRLRSWYRPRDLLGVDDELVVGPGLACDDVVAMIVEHAGFPAAPVRRRFGAELHL